MGRYASCHRCCAIDDGKRDGTDQQWDDRSDARIEFLLAIRRLFCALDL
jgi:hypothetical protein